MFNVGIHVMPGKEKKCSFFYLKKNILTAWYYMHVSCVMHEKSYAHGKLMVMPVRHWLP